MGDKNCKPKKIRLQEEPGMVKERTFNFPLIQGHTKYSLSCVASKGVVQTTAEMIQCATRQFGCGVLAEVDYDHARRTAGIVLIPGSGLDSTVERASGAAWSALQKASDRYGFRIGA